ncbi:hypothetical protein SFC88_15720 [Nocardioides sp. HM23]|uniref:hypothetical protein n=1 Tax=Nocardioides bizhenqiangii TaxID=3095076 RepID=UPI002ACAAE90|nr:hypothetical protein [Nocardioides sp. HM23]MDZ5622290.1 hypothetical protein [Nocardioides sp. HM23]
MSTQSIAFTVPLLPGMTDVDRSSMQSCWHGDRAADHQASRRELGITRESVWIQPTSEGDVAVVLLEAEDLGKALAGIGGSDEPFDVWFRAHCLHVHGIDLAAGFPPPEQIFDYQT